MDDLEFRRTVYADPHTEDAQVKQSAEQDKGKQAFIDDMRAFDGKLANALKVPVPENLCERLILRQSLESHKQDRRRTRWHIAMAASVAFAVGLTVHMLYQPFAGDSIGTYSLAHVNHGIDHLYNANENNSVDQLNVKLARFGGHFNSAMGKAIFSNYCDFAGVTSLHLIFENELGRISVFVTPADADFKFVEDFSDEHFVGKALAYERAMVTIVGDKDKPLGDFTQRLKDNISWEI